MVPMKILSNKYLIGTIATLALAGSFAFAQTDAITPAPSVSPNSPKITFPIPELGDCADKESCKTYCSKQENMVACTQFAAAHGLAPREQVAKVIKFAEGLRQGGPGGCTSPDACRSYCADSKHLDECIKFAKEHDFVPKEKLEEAQKLADALKQAGALPGGCKTKDQCKAYCENVQHASECLAFAVKAGFITPAMAEQARKMLALVKTGETPGGCKTKEDCQAYCHTPEHVSACADFGVKLGVTTQENADKMKQLGTTGPGGCQGEACRTFCADPANQQTCLDFAKEHNLLPPKASPPAQGLTFPPHALDCVRKAGGDELVNLVMEQGTRVITTDIGMKIKECMSQFPMPSQGQEPVKPSWSPYPSRSPGISIPPIPAGCHLEKVQCDSPTGCRPLLVCPSVSARPFPSVSCMPRPACLNIDGPTRCLLPEPANGWCPPKPSDFAPPPSPTPATNAGSESPSALNVLGSLIVHLLVGR